jgi:hypothetical protein
LKVIKVSYFKDGEEGACEFFNENADMDNIKAKANEFNSKFNCTCQIKLIEVKYIVLIQNGNMGSNYDSWVAYYSEKEYESALNIYNYEKSNDVKDDKRIVELITL